MNEIQFSTLGRIQNSHRLGIELTLSGSLYRRPKPPLICSFQSPFLFKASTPAEIFGSKRARLLFLLIGTETSARPQQVFFFFLIPQSVDGPYNILALLDGPKTSLSGPTPSRIENKKSVLLPFSFSTFNPKLDHQIRGGGGVIPELCGQVSTSNHKC